MCVILGKVSAEGRKIRKGWAAIRKSLPPKQALPPNRGHEGASIDDGTEVESANMNGRICIRRFPKLSESKVDEDDVLFSRGAKNLGEEENELKL